LLDPKHLYTIIRKDRSSGKGGGGVCSFVNQNILICQLTLPEIYADFEMLCFDIVNLVPPVRYFLVYRLFNIGPMRSLVECLELLTVSKHINVIVGDFNLPKINWATVAPMISFISHFWILPLTMVFHNCPVCY